MNARRNTRSRARNSLRIYRTNELLLATTQVCRLSELSRSRRSLNARAMRVAARNFARGLSKRRPRRNPRGRSTALVHKALTSREMFTRVALVNPFTFGARPLANPSY